MGLLDRFFGTHEAHARHTGAAPRPAPPGSDVYALERYRYMIQTAPPETVEQAHAEAFAKLTPEQRQQVLRELAQAAPPGERGAIEQGAADPRALARVATRAEVRQPGILERTLGTSPGSGFGAGLLGSFAAAFAGSMVANAFFSSIGDGVDFGVGDGADADGALDGDIGGDANVDAADGFAGDVGDIGDFDI